ncbi:MAG: choice-of-anchor J domain-containing protein [Saprospiraceae bacterium]|jgi:hypothetical protein|nr:choice-of-anchor J domain-containing protein [Saprospiraceae bacterium]HQV96642.1 choice-of-anchor J domain-containing protein [Saprospiraceae bacterium]
MKQFLLLLTLVVFSFSSYGQVLYEQDFTNGKGDMITIDNDKKSPNSQVADYAESWGVRNGVAINNSWYEPVGKADDWLITPIITGITDKTILTWTAAAFDATFSNTYRVMVSPTGGENISDFTDVLIDVGPENNQLTNRLANLDKYVGKSIRIAFHDYSNDLFLMLVDNIKVITLIDVDGQVSEALSTSYVVKNSETDVLFQFRNVGLNPITSAVLEVSDGTLSENINIDGINLAYAETYENVYKYTVKNTTKNTITFKIKSVNGGTDLNAVNDSKSVDIYGVSKKISKKMLAEEATGTWCTWCPRGAVFMAKMKEDYPDDFIGIAVHNQDPMTLTSYNTGLTNLPGFSGFPSVVVNRQNIIDPEEMPEYFTEIASREVAPIELNVQQSKVSRKITISGDIEFFTNIDDADFSVVAVIVEDSVKGTTSGYNQVNSYAGGANGEMGGYENLPNPVPASQMVYNEVGRALPFGFAGKNDIIPSKVKEGDVFLFSVDYTAPTSQKIENLHSVLFLVNNTTGQIVNAAKTESFAVKVDDIAELDHVSLSPNPTSNTSYLNINLNTSSDVNVNISNNMGQIVASKNYGKLSGLQILPIVADNFSSGIYFVQILVNGKSTVQKLIVE